MIYICRQKNNSLEPQPLTKKQNLLTAGVNYQFVPTPADGKRPEGQHTAKKVRTQLITALDPCRSEQPSRWYRASCAPSGRRGCPRPLTVKDGHPPYNRIARLKAKRRKRKDFICQARSHGHEDCGPGSSHPLGGKETSVVKKKY